MLLLCCGAVCGGGVREGTMLLAQLSASFQSLPPLPTSKLGPSDADSWVCGFVYILGPRWSNELSCEAGSFSHHCNTHRFLQPEVWGLYIPMLGPWVAWFFSLPSWSSQFLHMQMWDCLVGQLLPCWASSLLRLLVSTTPTSLNACFFINSLVVGLPYSSILWQFWLFFVFKFVVVFFLVVWGGKAYLPMPLSWPEVEFSIYGPVGNYWKSCISDITGGFLNGPHLF